MDNNQFNQFNPQGVNGTKQIFKWVGLGCSSLGFLLTFIFSIITCSRGGKKFEHAGEEGEKIKMSLAFIGIIIGVMIAITGVVLSILSLERGAKINNIVMISLAVGVFAILYGILTHVTICSYTCQLNNSNYMKLIRGLRDLY